MSKQLYLKKFNLYNSISFFRYQGCTTVETDGKEWCAIGIHPGQAYSQGAWAYCTESNSGQPGPYRQHGQPGHHRQPVRHGHHGQHHGYQETAFRRCKIPFQYNGQTYYQCTNVGHSGPWCYFDQNNWRAWGNC